MLNNAVQRTFLHMFARDIRKHIKINIIGEKSVSGGAIAHPSPRVSRPLIHWQWQIKITTILSTPLLTALQDVKTRVLIIVPATGNENAESVKTKDDLLESAVILFSDKVLLLKKYFMLDIHDDFNLNWLGCLGAFYFRMLGLYKKQLWISTFKNQQFIHANHYLTCSGHYSFNFPQLLFFLPLAKKCGGFSPPCPPPPLRGTSLIDLFDKPLHHGWFRTKIAKKYLTRAVMV